MMGFPWEEISSLIWKWFIYKQTQVSLTWKQWGLPKKAGCICGMSVLVFAYIVIKVIVGAVKIVCRQKRRQPPVERRNGARREIQGIPNIGNTCYMNAVLQMFCRTPHFRGRLQQAVEKKWKQVGYLERLKQFLTPPPPKIDIALLCLVEAVAYGSPVPSSFPLGVLKAVRKIDKTFLGNKQQDSYQFFNTVMEGLEDCSQWKKMMNPNETATETLMNNSPVSRLFGGVFCTIYTYDTCNHIELVFQRYTSIPVPIDHIRTKVKDENDKSTKKNNNDLRKPKSGKQLYPYSLPEQEEKDRRKKMKEEGKQQLDERDDINGSEKKPESGTSLYPSLPPEQEEKEKRKKKQEQPLCHRRLRKLSESFTDLENGLKMWTDIECFQDFSCRICEKGKHVVSSSRTLLMDQLPPVLVFQFNRFKMGFNGTLDKMDEMLSYPECFDMAPYCSNGVEVFNRMTGSDSGEYRYRLYGIVSHSGSSHGGHYIARVRKTEQGQWQDPERFKEGMMQFWEGKKQLSHYKSTESGTDKWYTINDTFVNEDNSETALRDPNAYLLFYERV